MSLQLPEMGPPQGAPPGLPQDLQDNPAGDQQLECLQKVLDDFPRLLTELQDPKHVETAVSALKALANIQTQLMSEGGPGAAQTPR